MSDFSSSRFGQNDDIQQSLEKTLKLLAESEQEKNDLKLELLSVKRDLREIKRQKDDYLLSNDSDSLNFYSNQINTDIYNNKINSQSSDFPESLIRSEITSFYLFAQNCYHKCLINDSISEEIKEQLKSSSSKLQEISENNKSLDSKLSNFFGEIHDFCQICVDALNDSFPSNSAISQQVHDAEMQKIKLQNQTFSLQQKFNEESEKSQSLKEQIEREHKLMKDFTRQFSLLSPIKDDARFIERNLNLIKEQMNQNENAANENSSKMTQIISMISEFLKDQGSLVGLPIQTDEPSILKRLLADFKAKYNQNETIIQNILASLSLTTTEASKISKEITKLLNDKKTLQQLQKELNDTRTKNQSLELSLNDLSSKNKQTSDSYASIATKVQQLKNRVEELENEKNRLEDENHQLSLNCSVLTNENQILDQQKLKANSSLSKAELEVSNLNDKVATLQANVDDLTERNRYLTQQIEAALHTNSQLSLRSSQLTDDNQNLSGELENLTQSHNGLSTELKLKNENIERLTKSLQIANSQVSDLRARLLASTDENRKLKGLQEKLDSVTKENSSNIAEIDRISKELFALNSVKEELERTSEQYKQSQESLDGLLTVYQTEKEKHQQIKQQMASIHTMQEKIDVLQSENNELIEKLVQFPKIIRKYKDLKVIEKRERIQLSKLRNISSENLALSDKCLNLTNELHDMKKLYTSLEIEHSKIQSEYEKLKINFDGIQQQKLLLEKNQNSINSDNHKLAESLEKYQSNLQESTLKIDEIESTKNSLELENNSLKKKIESLEFEKSVQQKNQDTLENVITIQKSENENLLKKVEELEILRNTKIELEKKNESQEIQISNLRERLDNLEKAKDNLSSSIENHNNKNKALEIELNSKISEFNAIQSTLNSQIETKSFIINNQTTQIEDLKSTIQNISEKLSLYQTQNEAMKEQLNNKSAMLKNHENKLNDQNSSIESMKDTISKLSEKNSQLSQTTSSLLSQIDAKSLQLESNDKEISELRRANQTLTSSLDRSSLKISELQSNKLAQSQLEKDHHMLQQKLEESARQNERLIKTMARMKGKMETILSNNEMLLKRIDKFNVKMQQIQEENDQKDNQIQKLKRFIKSQEVSYEESERQRAELAEKVNRTEGRDVWDLMKKVENSLFSFPIDRDTIKGDGSIISKLKSIDSMVSRVRTLYDEQDRSLERLTSLTSTQHDTIVRMSQGKPTK
ncbi:hypothetical protein TRFO_10606 [Tritrichomonas foetus]|uniref:Uncharacterized protein n=1 Tax=Tritrichomonas foetus TaxID=1144522 RepID=A0A1J4JCZ1_9EUKA|nr:hypothetical protein TRFO_10606 [Tritrichomonas foetus]|eukprot:OHS95140.1 hypothetical protein TRFO_10606 [Tritrichomonas foetus]